MNDQLQTELDYPDSDGQPIADNTLQFQWIVTIEGNIDAMYPADGNVFVAGDLFWYPVKGQPGIRVAPDTLAVFGRPKGYRGSYKHWMEDGIAPQVVFEVLSPNNATREMDEKFDFYEKYGVEEYYFFDPYDHVLQGWLRDGRKLQTIEQIDGWVSPRLGIRFDLSSGELVIYRPDGQRFLTFLELMRRKDEVELQKEEAERRAGRERQEKEEAERRAARERQEKEEAERRAERLAAQLRRAGIEPEQ